MRCFLSFIRRFMNCFRRFFRCFMNSLGRLICRFFKHFFCLIRCFLRSFSYLFCRFFCFISHRFGNIRCFFLYFLRILLRRLFHIPGLHLLSAVRAVCHIFRNHSAAFNTSCRTFQNRDLAFVLFNFLFPFFYRITNLRSAIVKFFA